MPAGNKLAQGAWGFRISPPEDWERLSREDSAKRRGDTCGKCGRLLLRACLTSQGQPNDVDEAGVRACFVGWQFVNLERARIASDTRTMEALVVRLQRCPV